MKISSLLSSMVTKAGKTVLASRNYTFNAVNNITQIVDGAGTTSYPYDNIDQLLSETRSGYSCAYYLRCQRQPPDKNAERRDGDLFL